MWFPLFLSCLFADSRSCQYYNRRIDQLSDSIWDLNHAMHEVRKAREEGHMGRAKFFAVNLGAMRLELEMLAEIDQLTAAAKDKGSYQ